MQPAQCQHVVLSPKCRILSHFISFEYGILSQEAHLYFACHLEIASTWLSETGGAVKYKVEVENVEAGGVIAQCVIYLQCQ